MPKRVSGADLGPVRMESGMERIVPGAGEVERLVDVRPTPFPGGSMLTFSLRGVWSCCRTRKAYPEWSERRILCLRLEADYLRSGSGGDADVRVSVTVSRLLAFGLGGLGGANGREIFRILDVYALRQEVDRRVADGSLPGALALRPAVADDHALDEGEAANACAEGQFDLGEGRGIGRVFEYGDRRVRTVLIDEQAWFVATDVCAVLGHGTPAKATSRLSADEKGMTTIHTLGGPQSLTIVSESGLYLLVMTSRKPAAQGFRKWVTGEVLPALRRTGHYEVSAANDAAKVEGGPCWADVLADPPMVPRLSAETVPLSIRSYLSTKGFGRGGAGLHFADGAGGLLSSQAQKELVVSLVTAGDPACWFCRHPETGDLLFSRPALDAWWAAHEGEIVAASLGK